MRYDIDKSKLAFLTGSDIVHTASGLKVNFNSLEYDEMICDRIFEAGVQTKQDFFLAYGHEFEETFFCPFDSYLKEENLCIREGRN